jgi:hypothetical protein
MALTDRPPQPETPATSPYEKRRQATALRLSAALARLVNGTPCHPSLKGQSYRLSVTVLAREAGIGRNAIYTNHRNLIDELTQAATNLTNSRQAGSSQDNLATLRAMHDELKGQNRRLATENAALLKRALDAEARAARLERRVAQLTQELRKVRRPAPLPLREES